MELDLYTTILPLFLILILLVLLLHCFWWLDGLDGLNVAIQQSTNNFIRLSDLNNNHDHLKVKHATEQEAEAEIRRMQRNNYEGSERMVAYYNTELQGWFVGKKKYYG